MPDSSPPVKESGSLFRGVARHSLVYGIGMLVSRGVSFIMLPVYTRYLTPADYGVMALIMMTLDFISIIGGAQLAMGVFRFYHKTDVEKTKREVVSTSFLIVGIMYAVVGAFTFAMAGVLSQMIFGSGIHTDLIRVAAADLAMSSLLIVPMSLARVKNMSTFFVGTNLVKMAIGLSLNILFIVFMGMGVMGIFLASLISNGLVGGFISIWLVRRVGLNPSMEWTRNLMRYGVPLMATQVATFIATFSDRYFLQAVADETVVGLYSLAYQFGFLMVMVGYTPMDMVWGPKRFEIARNEDRGARDALLSRGFLIMNLLLLTTAVGITLYVGDVLRIMATPAFHPAARVVPVILIAYVFQTWASVQDIGILVREKTKYITLANFIAAGVAVAGYATLIPLYFEWGAAIATVIAFFVRYILTYRFSQTLWRVNYEWRPVAVLGAWAVTISIAGLALPQMSIWLSLALRTTLVGVFLTGVWLLPILKPDDRVAVRGMVGRFVLRRG